MFERISHKPSMSIVIAAAVATLSAASANAAETSANGFAVRRELVIAAPPAKVYEALVGQVGSWWSPQHTYSGDSRNLSIDPRPGGCFCERLPDGGVEHMRVIHVRRDALLRMAGGLGPLQAAGVSGPMTWRLARLDDGTRLELVYTVGGYMAGGFDAIAPAVERVLGEQAERLKRFVETGAPAATGG